MNWKKMIIYFIFNTLLIVFGAILSAMILSMLKHYSNGWDGISAVLGALMVGGFLGLIAGLFLCQFLSLKLIIRGSIIIVLFIIVQLSYLALRPKKAKVKSQFRTRSETFYAPPSDCLGDYLGVVNLNFKANQKIFLNAVKYKNETRLYYPCDSLVIGPNANALSYAPPYLVPYWNKPDYQICYMRVKSKAMHFYEIELNPIQQRTAWIDKNHVKFMDWEDYILNLSSVELKSIDDVNNEIQIKPIKTSSLVKLEHPHAQYLLIPISIRKEWLQVQIEDDSGNYYGRGWIRWRSGNQLLVNQNLLS